MLTCQLATYAIPAAGIDAAFAGTIKSELMDSGLVRITNFPADPATYIAFLAKFGEPLCYYGDDKGTHPDNAAIWRIKYEPDGAANGEVHALAGPLTPHSSQSLRSPRPPYFSMLMVDNGWQSRPDGENGESLLVPWRDAIQLIKTRPDGAGTVSDLHADIPFPDGVSRSVVYELPTAKDPDDVGVRLKSDLLAYLQTTAPSHPGTLAVERLTEAAVQVARRIRLASGDLLLLDNDRWGHGRESVVGFQSNPDGSMLLNPRELWSVTVG